MWLTSHQRRTVALLHTGSPGTIREIFSEDANGQAQPSVYNRGVASSSLTIGNDYDAVSDVDVVG